MGRRALRNVDKGLDLSRHLIASFDGLPNPWNPAAIFDREGPLEVEVGSGKGLFMAKAAAAIPEHTFLGIEIAGKYARFAAARLAKAQLHNAAMVQADAQRVFADLLPDHSVHAVHIYFPDPWWKKRHRKRRVIQQRFLEGVQRSLKAEGVLHFWTDVKEYYEEGLELITRHTGLTGPHPVAERPAEHELDYRTHFERRMRLVGKPIHRAEFLKQ